MPKQKIYISVPIHGNENHSKQVQKAYRLISSNQVIAIMPFDLNRLLDRSHISNNWPPPTEIDYLLNDIKELSKCDGIYFCEGWQNSLGCNVEFSFAKYLCRSRPDFKFYFQE